MSALPKPTQCVDIAVGYTESGREDLIDFLKRHAVPLSATSAERGEWNDIKILRVHTSDGEKLAAFVAGEYRLGDDCIYEVHMSPVDAARCMTYLPDLDSPHGYKEFNL